MKFYVYQTNIEHRFIYIEGIRPKNGFNDFFENLKIYLEKNNVKLNMAAVIKPIWEKIIF